MLQEVTLLIHNIVREKRLLLLFVSLHLALLWGIWYLTLGHMPRGTIPAVSYVFGFTVPRWTDAIVAPLLPLARVWVLRSKLPRRIDLYEGEGMIPSMLLFFIIYGGLIGAGGAISDLWNNPEIHVALWVVALFFAFGMLTLPAGVISGSIGFAIGLILGYGIPCGLVGGLELAMAFLTVRAALVGFACGIGYIYRSIEKSFEKEAAKE